ncbi:MAG TPA: PaaI family thioesterase [Deltaproteobacteria bacterium]|nr:thioesterase [Deltaproteobacteria bacterium]HCP44942.1 PaaI family thioesterase [Deltaproteobacteria bacterium]|tara:strand:- start:185 stop:649 length:465 start_codon:yes stop_codon:yes gene_type:complete
MATTSLQQEYGAKGICFGCGPSNEKGLRINSFPDGDQVICQWDPEQHHQAFPGMLNGGIIGALLDCHSNWAAAWALMNDQGLDEPPCTVTASFSVRLRRPTPADQTVHLRAWTTEINGNKAVVESELSCAGKVCATCTGTFVAVGADHPAYHRW